MKVLYLDCFAGISGDMFLGALLDLGVSEDVLRAELSKLELPGYQISSRRVIKQNISATKFDVITMEDRRLIEASLQSTVNTEGTLKSSV